MQISENLFMHEKNGKIEKPVFFPKNVLTFNHEINELVTPTLILYFLIITTPMNARNEKEKVE
jgi:hypothetical protein